METTQKKEQNQPQRVVILRALQLGDLLCSVPAFRSLRSAYPAAVITLVGLPWAREFVERFNHLLDDFIEFPGFPGLPERPVQIERFPRFLSEMQRLGFDLAIQMQGSGNITNSLIQLFGARRTAGFFLADQNCPDPETFLPYPEGEPEVRRHLKLMEFLGLPIQGEDLEFPLYQRDWQAFQALQARCGLQPRAYICLHPGSRAEARRWPVERFACVADALVRQGYQIVLTGTHDEAHLTAAVAALMQAEPCNLTGLTDLGSLGALVSEARLLVCNDTGPSHLAAALRTPSVVLFSTSDPERWAPSDRKLHRPILEARKVDPPQVIAAAESLLQEEHGLVV